MTDELKRAFDGEMVAIYREAAAFGCRPTYMLGMASKHRGLEAARRLLRAGDQASGLK